MTVYYTGCPSWSFHRRTGPSEAARTPAGAGSGTIILEEAAIANVLVSADTCWWRVTISKRSSPQTTKVFSLMEPMLLRALHFSVWILTVRINRPKAPGVWEDTRFFICTLQLAAGRIKIYLNNMVLQFSLHVSYNTCSYFILMWNITNFCVSSERVYWTLQLRNSILWLFWGNDEKFTVNSHWGC